MTLAIRPLTFSEVDELCFASARGLLDPANITACYSPDSLGPLLELLLLLEGRLPSNIKAEDFIISRNGTTAFIRAMGEKRHSWLSPDRRLGIIRTMYVGHDDTISLTTFLMDAQRAAHDLAELPKATAAQFVAAMRELESNIHEHSDAEDTGVLAFRATPGSFEFVVADLGIGVLNSLRKCRDFRLLDNHGDALSAALHEGNSRFGVHSNHGFGFRPIFIGLANRNGILRFRSGDHALTMDGSSPSLERSQLSQKAFAKGFCISVQCLLNER